jgi:hypothetical protein
VIVSGLPEGAYVKSIRYGGQDVPAGIDLSAAGAGAGILEITLAPNAATITGIVRDQKGDPVSPRDRESVDQRRDLAGSPITRSDGSFEIKNLAPGDFQVYCGEEDVLGDPAFRKLFEKQIPKVTLKEGSRERVDSR